MKMLNTLFKNSDYLELALIHRSFPFKNKKLDGTGHNERLEFLGDSVLGMVVAEHLMRLFPDVDEGVLSQMRASLVSEEALANIAKDLGLNEELKLSFQEERNGGREKSRILASSFEAILGALFLDSGFAAVKKFILEVYQKRWPETEVRTSWDKDYKSQLQELAQKTSQNLPVYDLIEEKGPDHDKNFKVRVQTLGQSFVGQAKSKKQAEQSAAQKALKHLKLLKASQNSKISKDIKVATSKKAKTLNEKNKKSLSAQETNL